MKKLLVLIMTMVLCIAICGCEDQAKLSSDLSPLTQEVLNRVSNEKYSKLITKSYTSYQWNKFYLLNVSDNPHINGNTTNIATSELNDDIVIIDRSFPIECLRKNGDVIYSIYSIEDDYLLFIEYVKYNMEGVCSLKVNEPSFVLPTTVTLTDKEIFSLKKDVSTLADVERIDPTVTQGYSIRAQRNRFEKYEAKYYKELDFESFCSMTLFSTIHYTIEGNWYKINYGANNEDFSNVEDWLLNEYKPSAKPEVVSSIKPGFYKVLSIERIEAPQILEQDLPK